MPEYSYRMVYLPRGTSRDAARRILTDHAEHGDWELTRLRLYADGSRKLPCGARSYAQFAPDDVHVRRKKGKRPAAQWRGAGR